MQKWSWTLYIINKVNSKWIKDLNIRAKTIKLCEDNTGKKVYDIRFGSDLLDITPEAQGTKKNWQIGLHQK